MVSVVNTAPEMPLLTSKAQGGKQAASHPFHKGLENILT